MRLGDKCGRLMEDRMRFCGASRLQAILVKATILSAATSFDWPLPTSAQTRAPLLTADQEACFGRVYDRAHLASHPSQKVTSLHIFRPLGERPDAEYVRAGAREEALQRDW
jgi:hypothetical protein